MLHDSHMNRVLAALGRDAEAPPPSVDTGIACAAIVGIAASLAIAPDLRGVLGALLAVVAVAIAAIDGRRFIIPNELNAAAFCLALVAAAAKDFDAAFPAMADAVVRGAVLALLFFGLSVGYRRIRGHDGLGLGDVKLAGAAGAWLDWQTVAVAVEIAAFAAIAVYLARRYVLGQSMSLTSRLPYGLFFAPAIWLGWLMETAGLLPLGMMPS